MIRKEVPDINTWGGGEEEKERKNSLAFLTSNWEEKNTSRERLNLFIWCELGL